MTRDPDARDFSLTDLFYSPASPASASRYPNIQLDKDFFCFVSVSVSFFTVRFSFASSLSAPFHWSVLAASWPTAGQGPVMDRLFLPLHAHALSCQTQTQNPAFSRPKTQPRDPAREKKRIQKRYPEKLRRKRRRILKDVTDRSLGFAEAKRPTYSDVGRLCVLFYPRHSQCLFEFEW